MVFYCRVREIFVLCNMFLPRDDVVVTGTVGAVLFVHVFFATVKALINVCSF